MRRTLLIALAALALAGVCLFHAPAPSRAAPAEPAAASKVYGEWH